MQTSSRSLLAILASVMLLCGACQPDIIREDPSKPVQGVRIDPLQLTLEPGKSHTLQANVIPPDADDPGVSWTTSDSAVITVKDGVVTAVGAGRGQVGAAGCPARTSWVIIGRCDEARQSRDRSSSD